MSADLRISLALVMLASLTPGVLRSQSVDLEPPAWGHEAAPLFVENRGQWNADARFLARMPGLDLWITAREIVYDFHRLSPRADSRRGGMSFSPETVQRRRGHVVRTRFIGALPEGDARPDDHRADLSLRNFFSGSNPSRRAISARAFGAVRLERLYPGIDAIVHFDAGAPRYDLLLQPGADPSLVRMSLEGASVVRLAGSGELVLTTSIGDVTQRRLYAYQEIDGARRQISCGFTVRRDGSVGFTLGRYDRSRPLVIDPTISFSTFYGGAESETGEDVAVDRFGNTYVIGTTVSTDLPMTAGSYDRVINGDSDVYLAKLSNDGRSLLYATYMGGASADYGRSIALDDDGNVYVSGSTSSSDFPTTRGAYSVVKGNNDDLFVAKLTGGSGTLLYSTFIGGNGHDEVSDISVDAIGTVYLVGVTTSNDLPTTSGAYQNISTGGGGDVLIARLNGTGTGLLYLTYLGGGGVDYARAIALDAGQSIYVVGATESTDFPTTVTAYRSTKFSVGDFDGFVTKLDSLGRSLIYSTFLGGGPNGQGDSNAFDVVNAVAVDGAGCAFVTGRTNAPTFPTTVGAYQRAYSVHVRDARNPADAFVTKLDPAGTRLLYSTYLGGNEYDEATEIVLDGGSVYLFGASTSTNLPVTWIDAIQRQRRGDTTDLFLAKLGPNGANILYCTYLGGDSAEAPGGMVRDQHDGLRLSGTSFSPNFPTTRSAYQPGLNAGGRSDAFLMHIAFSMPHLSGFDFGPRWVIDPTPCTKSDVSDYRSTVRLSNSGTSTFAVAAVELIGPDADSGYFRLAPVPSLRPGDSIRPTSAGDAPYLQGISFRPMDEREYSCMLRVRTTNGAIVEAPIFGTGIESHVAISDTTDFGTAWHGDGATFVRDSVTITALPTRPLTITDIAITGPGAEHFRFDLDHPNFPFGGLPTEKPWPALIPGTSVTIPVLFTPRTLGFKNARIVVTGDHAYCDDSTGVLRGLSAVLPVRANGHDFGSILTCGAADTVVVLSNFGQMQVRVLDIRMTGDPEFELTAPQTPVTLSTGRQLRVPVLFSPSEPRSYQATVTFEVWNSGGTQKIADVEAKLTGIGYAVRVSAHIEQGRTADLGDTIDVPVILDDAIDPSNINGLRFALNYESAMLHLHNADASRLETMVEGTLLAGWSIIVDSAAPGIFKARLAAPSGSYLRGVGALLMLRFIVHSGTKTYSALPFSMAPLTTFCVAIDAKPGSVSLSSAVPSDVLELSRVTADPNPSRGEVRIEYGITRTGPVRVEIFNSAGMLIDRLMDRTLTPGEYSVVWRANELPSGIYFYRITAGGSTASGSILLQR